MAGMRRRWWVLLIVAVLVACAGCAWLLTAKHERSIHCIGLGVWCNGPGEGG